MEKEYYEKARLLDNEIDNLKYLLKSTSNGSPSCGLEIIVNTGYSDMGRDLTCNMKTRDDLAIEIWRMVREHIQSKIDKLEKEFEEL